VLVDASEPIFANRLRATIGGASDDAEITVVAPVEGVDDVGLDGRPDASKRDPVNAAEDVLVTFSAERIALFIRPFSERRCDEGIDADALEQRLGLPVQQAE
jgi:hypothetical protein